MLRFSLILLIFGFLCVGNLEAQDTCYVQKYDNLLSLKTFGYNDGFSFRNAGTGFNYIPDLHSGLGVGFWCKYFPFDVCYRQEISMVGSREDYHRLKTTDMQLRGYNKYFAGDIYIQNYRGFYEIFENRFDKKFLDTDIDYSPDLSVFQFDMVGKYIFNHERFSYKAGFTANERQRISAGSPTLGAALYFLKIKSDSLLIKEDGTNYKSCNIGVNGGYAYNFVFGTRSTLFLSGSLGLNSSNAIFKSKDNGGIRLSPVFHFKGAYWLNYDKWSFGFTTTYNVIHQTLDRNLTLYVHTRRNEIMVIRRISFSK